MFKWKSVILEQLVGILVLGLFGVSKFWTLMGRDTGHKV